MNEEPEPWAWPKSKLLDGIERWMRYAIYAMFAVLFCLLGIPLLFVIATHWRDIVNGVANAPAGDWKKVFGLLGLLLGAAICYVGLKALVRVGIGELVKLSREKALRSRSGAWIYCGCSAVLGGVIGWGISGELAVPWVRALYAVLFATVLGGMAYSTNRQDRAKPVDDEDKSSSE